MSTVLLEPTSDTQIIERVETKPDILTQVEAVMKLSLETREALLLRLMLSEQTSLETAYAACADDRRERLAKAMSEMRKLYDDVMSVMDALSASLKTANHTRKKRIIDGITAKNFRRFSMVMNFSERYKDDQILQRGLIAAERRLQSSDVIERNLAG